MNYARDKKGFVLMIEDHAGEIEKGERFRFGENWANFLRTLNDDRIGVAEQSLCDMLGQKSLQGLSFVDVGCGSGLFSLVARRLGAKVRSFDFDPQSAHCSRELRSRYFPDDPDWVITEGSVLDEVFIKSLGKFDIVYSWGVLHHTGNMWRALNLVTNLLGNKGQLFISIYNDQGNISKRWAIVKKIYCSTYLGRLLIKMIFVTYFTLNQFMSDVINLRNPIKSYTEYYKQRGMSRVHDWYDWLGGYPFEVAKPEEIFDFYHPKSLKMQRMTTCGGGLGCNQFVFLFDKPIAE